jgi:hypothetical protein
MFVSRLDVAHDVELGVVEQLDKLSNEDLSGDRA